MTLSPTAPELLGLGTPEASWQSHPRLAELVRLDPRQVRAARVVVVAPHPDDEILGVGGLTTLLSRAGAEVVLVAVTDGDASHPGRARALRRLRPAESERAATALGVGWSDVIRLRQPDGATDEEALTSDLVGILRPGDLALAPWAGDGHPDHDRTGRACARAAASVGATPWSYFVWAWHWSAPASPDLPWDRMVRVDLDADLLERKAAAAACFTTQLRGSVPILPDHVLCRLLRSFEVVARP